MQKTCANPAGEQFHTCPGRCACYINHGCVEGCTCSGCPHTDHLNQMLQANPDALQLIMDKARAMYR